MADLIITADVSSIRDAEKALDRFSNASQKMNRSVLGVAGKLKSLSSEWDRATRLNREGTLSSKALKAAQTELARELAVLNGYYKQNGQLNTQRALAELRAAQAARANARATEEAARAAQQAAQRQNELRMRFQEGYASFARARQQMRDLREAYRQGIITAEQYRQQLERIRREHERGRTAGQGNIRGMNDFGMATQQVGYQVGDFLVQVQSGTNALVAFGQQATQLVGILPLVAPQLGLSTMAAIGLSAGLGIAIPLITAIGAAFLRTSGEGKTLTKTLEELETKSSDLKATLELLAEDDITDKFGDLSSAVRGLNQDILELQANSELKALDQSLEKLLGKANAGFGENVLQGLISIGTLGMNIKTDEMLDEEKFRKLGFAMGRETFNNYVASMQSAAQAGDRAGVVSLFEDFLSDATDNGEAVSGISKDAADFVVQLNKAMMALAESNKLLKGGRDTLRDKVKAYTEIEQSGNDLLNSLMNEAALNETILKFGEDSAQAEARRATQARETFVQKLNEEGITGEIRDRILEAYDNNVLLEEAISNSANQAERLSAAFLQASQNVMGLQSALSSLSMPFQGAMEDLDFQVSLAGMNAADRLVATRVRSLEESMRQASAKVFGFDYGLTDDQRQQLSEFEQAIRGQAGVLSPEKSGGGGAQQESTLKKLQEQLNLERELLGMSEARRRVVQALGDDYNTTSPEIVDGLIQQIEVLEELKAREKDIQGVFDTMQSSMSDAFMSMVDGTKSASDAFKDMARSIIKELYDVLVVQQLVGSFDKSSGQGTGIVGAIGGAIFGKATGGTMMPGSPYLVGEKGPEIVMPGSRSTVTPNHLSSVGGGQQTVDVRVFVDDNGNFDAKVAQISTDQIVKAAPAIVNQSVGAVVERTKRGGSMKDTFR